MTTIQVPVKSKPWWKSKTVLFNIIAAASVILLEVQELLGTFPEGSVPEWVTKVVVGAIAVINLVLRFTTGQPVTASMKPGAKMVDAPEHAPGSAFRP